MKISIAAKRREMARERNMRYKLRKVLPRDVVDGCQDFSDLKSKMIVADSIISVNKQRLNKPVHMSDIIRKEELAEGETLDEILFKVS